MKDTKVEKNLSVFDRCRIYTGTRESRIISFIEDDWGFNGIEVIGYIIDNPDRKDNRILIEVISFNLDSEYFGWRRDFNVPDDYVSKYTDRYWNVGNNYKITYL